MSRQIRVTIIGVRDRKIRSLLSELKLPKRWRIHDVFDVSLLERNTTRRGRIEQTIEEKPEFEDGAK